MNTLPKQFDIIVIGAGSGGLNIAGFMNSAGFSVLLIDKSDASIGGDCLNFGCVPSKALIHVARTVAAGRDAERFGVATSGVVNLARVMAYVREKQEVIREHENADYFREKGMTVELGEARFVGTQTVAVGDRHFSAKKIILGTGSRPRELELIGMGEMPVYTNETIFDATILPKRLVVVGGGPVGVEIGQAFAMLGSQVTIVAPDFLVKEDPEIAAVVQARMKVQGVTFCIGSQPTEVIEAHSLRIADKDGVTDILEADALFVSIGRVINTEGLALESAGIAYDERGHVKVDPYLRTTNKNVFTIGDIANGPMFTHAAEHQAKTLINNLFSPIKKKISYDTMSSVTYTTPEIATFGLSAETLTKRGATFKTLMTPFTSEDRAIVDEHTEGILKVYVSKKGVVLGGTMVAEGAGELVQELILAQTHGMTLKQLMQKVYPYPTKTRINRALALSFLKHSLTDSAKKLFHLLYR